MVLAFLSSENHKSLRSQHFSPVFSFMTFDPRGFLIVYSSQEAGEFSEPIKEDFVLQFIAKFWRYMVFPGEEVVGNCNLKSN